MNKADKALLKKQLTEIRSRGTAWAPTLLEFAQSRGDALSIWFSDLVDAFRSLSHFSFSVLESNADLFSQKKIIRIAAWVDAVKTQYAETALEFANLSKRWIQPKTLETEKELSAEWTKWEKEVSLVFLEVASLAEKNGQFVESAVLSGVVPLTKELQKLFDDLAPISQVSGKKFIGDLTRHGNFPFDEE